VFKKTYNTQTIAGILRTLNALNYGTFETIETFQQRFTNVTQQIIDFTKKTRGCTTGDLCRASSECRRARKSFRTGVTRKQHQQQAGTRGTIQHIIHLSHTEFIQADPKRPRPTNTQRRTRHKLHKQSEATQRHMLRAIPRPCAGGTYGQCTGSYMNNTTRTEA